MAINVADVIVEDHDIYGAGVNVTARLQTYAEVGGIVISGAVAEQIGSTLGAVAVDLGPIAMRNLVHSVRALSLRDCLTLCHHRSARYRGATRCGPLSPCYRFARKRPAPTRPISEMASSLFPELS